MSVQADLARQAEQLLASPQYSTVELARDLIAIPSASGDERRVAEFVEETLTSWGFETQRVPVTDRALIDAPEYAHEENLDTRPNVVAYLRSPRPAAPPVVLNGHLDVVPPGPEDQWTYPPFEPRIDDGRLYGRGASDTKAGVAGLLQVFRVLAASDVALPFDVRCELVVGEESGGIGTRQLISTLDLPSAAIITEPTSGIPVLAAGGALPFTLEVTGKPAHISTPWEGVSAFDLAVDAYKALMNLAAQRQQTLTHPMFDRLPQKAPVAIGTATAGEWRLSVPARAALAGRVGTLPGEDLDALRRQVVAAVTRASSSAPAGREATRVIWNGRGFVGWSTPLQAPIAQAILSATDLSGDDLRAVTYGSDAAHYAAAGVPVVLFGPGDLVAAHSFDESVALERVDEFARTLVRTISYLAEHPLGD